MDGQRVLALLLAFLMLSSAVVGFVSIL